MTSNDDMLPCFLRYLESLRERLGDDNAELAETRDGLELTVMCEVRYSLKNPEGPGYHCLPDPKSLSRDELTGMVIEIGLNPGKHEIICVCIDAEDFLEEEEEERRTFMDTKFSPKDNPYLDEAIKRKIIRDICDTLK